VYLETDRLIVRDVEDEDLDALLPIYLSNPLYLRLTEGREDGYDVGKLGRELAVARATPGRGFVAAFLKDEDGEAVAVVDWLLENESDGKPWIGLLMVRSDQQSRRIALDGESP
jgi:RimJ/RimL family protein N-acetyltransferase